MRTRIGKGMFGRGMRKLYSSAAHSAASCFCLIGSLLVSAAHAQDWQFNTPSDTNNCVVAPGAFSEGWVDTLYGMGTNQGVWDLGQQGYIAVMAVAPTNIAVTLSVDVVAWCDESLYPAPEVLIEKGQRLESSRTYYSGGLGAWQTFSSVWTVVSGDQTLVVVTQTNPQKSSVVDRITVGYGVPRPSDAKPPKKPRKK